MKDNEFLPVDVVLYPDKLIFEAGGRKFELPKWRINLVVCEQDIQREISKIKGTSGSATLGGRLFGSTGATIGAAGDRNVEYNTTIINYFVVKYRSQQGELQSITLRFFDGDGRKFSDACNRALIGNNTVL